ncbi:hypothetical protein [Nitrincola tapanii]|uniref:Uncharacterized protein n=1 Tax=Nitrincola tapanii TaxID=1708751 RepID=A0A5A9W1X8_9GAMM|nr:hypothetical protein [Nitrincola tapanii]KAA0874219.1 hypothetical protein E1H14_10635 [Nitrincola tapanii]
MNHAITGTGSQAFGYGISQYFAFLFMNIILIGLVITLAHKSYEMIFDTADNVMRWVGFGSRPLGEVQGEASTNRVYAGAAMYTRDASGAMVAKGSPGGSPRAAATTGATEKSESTSSASVNNSSVQGGTDSTGPTQTPAGSGSGKAGGGKQL